LPRNVAEDLTCCHSQHCYVENPTDLPSFHMTLDPHPPSEIKGLDFGHEVQQRRFDRFRAQCLKQRKAVVVRVGEDQRIYLYPGSAINVVMVAYDVGKSAEQREREQQEHQVQQILAEQQQQQQEEEQQRRQQDELQRQQAAAVHPGDKRRREEDPSRPPTSGQGLSADRDVKRQRLVLEEPLVIEEHQKPRDAEGRELKIDKWHRKDLQVPSMLIF
jgi:hypothetical protein